MNLAHYIDPTSLIFILLPIIAAMVSGGISIHGVNLVRHIIAEVSVIGMMMGLVIMLGNMSDPAALGPAFAIMLLVLLYGAIVYGLSTALLNAKPEATVGCHSRYRRAVACAVFLLTLVIVAGDNPLAFLDSDSVIFLTLSLIILYAILKASKSKIIFEALAYYLPHAGLIGFLMGVIVMLGNMSDPKEIGPAMAFACLSLLYSNIASVLLKLAKPNVIENGNPLSLGSLTSVIVGISITVAILLLSIAEF
jgi:hypothetical protein